MAYNLRERKLKAVYVDSESESDSYDDPDYSRRQPRRQQNRGTMKSPSTGPKEGQGVQVANSSGGAGSNRDMAGRRPSSPPRNAATPTPDKIGPVPRGRSRTKRRRAPYMLKKQPDPLEKATEKRTILALLIDLEIVKENEEVVYCDRARGVYTLRGKITRDGILCRCCNAIVTASEFQVHAGSAERAKPYQNIVLITSVWAGKECNLFECQIRAWVKGIDNGCNLHNVFTHKNNAKDNSDDACIICADGGDLICCDECPLTFHLDCLYLTNIPKNFWVCPCCLCRHCRRGGTKYKNITECRLCEKSYHLACHGNPMIEVSRLCSKFCGDTCIQLDSKLKRMVGVKNELGGGFSWTLLHHFNLLKNDDEEEQLDFYLKTECNSKIALAWDMMNRCFEPIVDRFTKINILKSVIYNTSSNLTRIDFKGFYTAVLEKDDKIVAAASLRLRGKEIAEMPFVATHKSYRKKEMLTKLMAKIEHFLAYMGIENLVLPSAEDVQEMWMEKFQFSCIPESMEAHIMLSKMLMFPNSVRLQKALFQENEEPNTEEPLGNPMPVVLPFDLNLEPPEEDQGDM